MQTTNHSRVTLVRLVASAVVLALLVLVVSAAVRKSASSSTVSIVQEPAAEGVTDGAGDGAVKVSAKVAANAVADRRLPARENGHRSLRNNPEGPEKPSAVPLQFTGYSEAPDFSVTPRRDELTFFPCEDCHGAMPPNPTPRELYSPHPALLDHGDGRMWCLDCHDAEDRNTLRTIANENVDFNDAYLVCGQCHYQPQKDWYFGAHGKRVANWQGERELYNCTHCHNPHSPAVRPRAPEPAPPIRRGLEPMPVHHLSGVAVSKESDHEN